MMTVLLMNIDLCNLLCADTYLPLMAADEIVAAPMYWQMQMPQLHMRRISYSIIKGSKGLPLRETATIYLKNGNKIRLDSHLWQNW